MIDERAAYLYARYQGECDPAAADFGKWWSAHPQVADLTTGYRAWRDECDSIQAWERELSDS